MPISARSYHYDTAVSYKKTDWKRKLLATVLANANSWQPFHDVESYES